MQRYRENRTPYREKAGKTPLPDIRPSYREQTDLLLDFLKKENEKDPSRNYKIPGMRRTFRSILFPEGPCFQ
ncbi:MAG: hypothetical protein U5N26_02320 [Candidatus Marinimicrobia bacterium]|nr:hypothetical protein [Candidatus Neomarinimicrobiota bacterium]